MPFRQSDQKYVDQTIQEALEATADLAMACAYGIQSGAVLMASAILEQAVHDLSPNAVEKIKVLSRCWDRAVPYGVVESLLDSETEEKQ